jgi:magnesium chelatase accessory protein
MADRLRWERDGADWPNRAASRFVEAAGLRWHVQRMGTGPTLLFVHGTGASTHSWRALLPLLAPHFDVIAPDLPGHGFTSSPPARLLSLPEMARGLGLLLRTLGAAPTIAVGHSAGAAILARMSLDGLLPELRVLISLNGALLPLRGMPEQIFQPIAKTLLQVPLVPRLFAWRAGERAVVERLLGGTGSTLDAEGVALYGRLAGSPAHAAAALGMMANWSLRPLQADLPRLKPRLVLVAAQRDRLIPASEAARVKALVPGAEIVELPGRGHLAHEEAPEETVALIERYAAEAGG